MIENEFNTKLLIEINSLRTNPKAYANKVRDYKKYFKGNILKLPDMTPIATTEGELAYEEAASILDNHQELNSLQINTNLNFIADTFLQQIQKFKDCDQISEIDIDSIIAKVGTIVGEYAQAIDFGSSIAELVIINLLVNDGDLNRGNRSNLLNSEFSLCGFANGKHKVYHYSTIVVFACHFYELGHNIDNIPDIENVDIEDNNLKFKQIEVEKKDYITKLQEKIDLPKGVIKIEKQEKIVNESGIEKRIIKLIKYWEDGTITTDIFKEQIN